jgi:hypothetical protein
MKPHRQRIAISKACGFKWSEYSDELGQLVAEFIPNYLVDLNAMHEAEKVLSRGEHYNQTGGFGRYKTALAEVCDEQHPIDATAAQRAEAFLRTIGKWEEEK